MLKANVTALALAVLPAAATVYLDTMTGGPPWTYGMYALDFVPLLLCWYVMALATLNVLAVYLALRKRVMQARDKVLPANRG